MTRNEAVRKFREHWNAIAESDLYFCGKGKTHIDVSRLESNCFLCEYVKQMGLVTCDNCPVWGEENRCVDRGSPYAKWEEIRASYMFNWGAFKPWLNRILPSATKMLAHRIANLPERNEHESSGV